MKKYYLSIVAILFSFTSYSQQNKMTSAEILKELSPSANGKTEVVKNFPENFPETLIARGKPIVYTKENSNNFEYIGMPIGGIGAGQLYLGGDGQLWFWDIFNLNYYKGQLKGEEAYEFPYERSKPDFKGARMIDQGFSITITSGREKITKRLNRDGFDNIEFLGQYPIGEVTYRDKTMPIKIKMEAFSPFIPLDLGNSILPATVFNFTIKNISNKPLSLDLEGWLENAVLVGTREKNEKFSGSLENVITSLGSNSLRLECSVQTDDSVVKNSLDYGSMSLCIVGSGGKVFAGSAKMVQSKLMNNEKLVGKLGSHLDLKPGEQKATSFILTWHFPKTYSAKSVIKNIPKNKRGDDTIRYYAKVFKDAPAVSDYVLKKREELTKNTRLWRDTWYNSTLPYWFLDRTFLNTSILASSTSNLIGDRMFYGTEGGNQGVGTCTHVWGYVLAPGHLFPDLEKSLREKVDFKPVNEGGALEQNGTVRCRWSEEGLAVDGQAGIIMRFYLTYQMSRDNSYLKKNYEGAKKVMQGLIDLKDADHDGILKGAQFNTLDAAWYGEITWLSLYYATALRAMAIMAKEVGDTEYSKYCIDIADRGRKYIEENLYNGEYFYQKGDPNHTESPGTYTGMEYSQLMGQSWAYQVGIGEVIDYEKAKKTLESMWRYNFSTDVGPFREKHKGGRWYAMPGEGGVIACTWPNGGSEVLGKGNERFANYQNECQNGYEYAATSLMMWQGMPYQSLAHIWYMHNNRYIGSKRNPWCEIEWGLHYSRSMASYGHFIASCGFEYNGPKGYMAFSPKVTPENFKSAFTAAEGWGTYEQKRTGTSQTSQMEIKFGSLRLKTIDLDIPKEWNTNEIVVTINGTGEVKSTFSRDKNRVTIELAGDTKIKAGQSLLVKIGD